MSIHCFYFGIFRNSKTTIASSMMNDHLFLQKLHELGLTSLPAPCCSPRQLAPLHILYMEGLDDEGDLILREGTLPDVLASSCGCF